MPSNKIIMLVIMTWSKLRVIDFLDRGFRPIEIRLLRTPEYRSIVATAVEAISITILI